jgi:hypothetical protein
VFGVSRVTVLRGFAVLLAVALLASLAAACDGGDGGGETPQADGGNGDGGNGDEDGGGGDGDEDGGGGDGDADGGGGDGDADGGGGDGDADGGGGGGDDASLQDLAALAGEATEGVIAKVTYSVTTSLDGESIEQEWVLARRPPDIRFETSIVEDGEAFRSILITTGGKSYACLSGGGEETCFATEAEEAEAFDFFFDVPRAIAEDVEDVGLVDSSQRTIAGLDATCFTVSSALASLGEGEICFSDHGLLLYLRGESDGEAFTFEATSVSTDVTDADFEPPYDIFELPDFDLPEE